LLCRSDAHRFLLPCPAPLLLCRGRRYSSFRPSVTYFSRLFLFFFFFFWSHFYFTLPAHNLSHFAIDITVTITIARSILGRCRESGLGKTE